MDNTDKSENMQAEPKKKRWSFKRMVEQNRKAAAQEVLVEEAEGRTVPEIRPAPAVSDPVKAVPKVLPVQAKPVQPKPVPAVPDRKPMSPKDVTAKEASVSESSRRRYLLSAKDDDLIIFLIRKHKTVGFIADRIGCSYKALDNYIHKVPEIQEAFTESKKRVDDLVQIRILEKIDKGDWAAIEFYAKHQMRHLGYGDEPVDKKIEEPQRIFIGKIDESEIPPEADRGASLVSGLIGDSGKADGGQVPDAAQPESEPERGGAQEERRQVQAEDAGTGGNPPAKEPPKEPPKQVPERQGKMSVAEMNGYEVSESPDGDAASPEEADDGASEFVLANGDGMDWP